MNGIKLYMYGNSNNLKYEKDIPIPKPVGKQILIKVAYAGINFFDIYQRNGLYPVSLPTVLGKEGTGVVAEFGPDVNFDNDTKDDDNSNISNMLAINSRVVFINAQTGSYAEYCLVDQDYVCLCPSSISPDIAAASLFQGLTAHYLLTSTFKIQPGHHVLIHAGAGGTGSIMIQMAKLKGAIVYTTVSTETKAELAKASGADHVIVYTKADFLEEIMKLTNNKGVDVVYDSVGESTYVKSMKSLKKLGYLVLFGNSSGKVPDINPLDLMYNGSLFMTRPTLGDYISTKEIFLNRTNELFNWITSNKITIRISEIFHLQDASDAHDFLESRKAIGKVLLEVNSNL